MQDGHSEHQHSCMGDSEQEQEENAVGTGDGCYEADLERNFWIG